MIPVKEFRRHAAECRGMARAARDPASKATWTRLADRWLVCADLAERAGSVRPAAPPRAKPEGPARQKIDSAPPRAKPEYPARQKIDSTPPPRAKPEYPARQTKAA